MAGGETDQLYQRLVLDHGRHPRNQGPLPGATHQAQGDNPFCGDRWLVSLILDGDQIREARFEGAGCAISTAAASMMTEAIRGRTREEAQRLARAFEGLVSPSRDGDGVGVGDGVDLGDLVAFAGVGRYPVRVKCARLPWQTLMAALGGASAGVSTE